MPEDPKGEKPASTEGEKPDSPSGEKPKGEFASEHSKQSLLADLAAARAKVKELEDKGKSDSDKLLDRALAAEKGKAEADYRVLRLETAVSKGLTPTLAKRLVGTTREELEADADELLSTLGAKPKEGEAENAAEGEKPGAGTKASTTGGSQARPTEKLKPGAAPSAEPVEMDPKKLADGVPRMY